MLAPHPAGFGVHRGYSWPGLEKVSNLMGDEEDADKAKRAKREICDVKVCVWIKGFAISSLFAPPCVCAGVFFFFYAFFPPPHIIHTPKPIPLDKPPLCLKPSTFSLFIFLLFFSSSPFLFFHVYFNKFR